MYRIMILDRERICREIPGLLSWEQYGFEQPVAAFDFPRGLDLARQLQPQVALVAEALGEWSGHEFACRLRQVSPGTICALMTSHPDVDGIRRAMRSGCRDLMKRPPDSRTLRDFLEWVLVEELQADLPGEKGEIRDPVTGQEYTSFGRITGMILQRVRTDYRQSLSLTSMAKTFEMSNKYIGRVFLRETGMRFTEYLMAYRMLEARRLIMTTGEKISVIAGMVGYSQLNNFYTHFRHYFGLSPSTLRGLPSAEEAAV